MSNKLSKEKIMEGIAAMERVQMMNPPSSEAWKRASVVMHRLVKELTGKEPQDALGK